MEIVQLILGIILSWVFWGHLIGGLVLWYISMLIIAQATYNGDGVHAANTAAWLSFLFVFLSAFLTSYFLWDGWVEIGVLTLAGILMPLVASIWFTAIE